MLRTADTVRLAGLGLLAIGVIAVHSAGMDPLARAGARPGAAAGEGGGVWAMFSTKHTALAVAAALLLLGMSRIDAGVWLRQRGWKNPVTFGLPIALGFCGAALIPGVGVEVNGATRWLALPGGLSFQPSELMKWALVAALAAWCGLRGPKMARLGGGLLPAAGVTALACGLIVKEDLGTAALLGGVAGVMLIAGGARLRHLAPVALIGIAAGAAFLATSPYRVRRLTAFLDPWADPMGSGYHPIQSMLGFAEGGVTGVGLGRSVQKYHVPEATTDFILPVISEEMGLLAVALIGLLFVSLVWSGVWVARRRTDATGRLLALGIVTMVGTQAVFNIAVVTVVVPTKGIALPLVSAGGTGWLLTAGALGVLAGLARGAEEQESFGIVGLNAPAAGASPSLGSASA